MKMDTKKDTNGLVDDQRLVSIQIRPRVNNELDLMIPGKFAYVCNSDDEVALTATAGFASSLVKCGTLIAGLDTVLVISGTPDAYVITETLVDADGSFKAVTSA